MSCFTASPNLQTLIRDSPSTMALSLPAAPSSCDLPAHVTVSFPPYRDFRFCEFAMRRNRTPGIFDPRSPMPPILRPQQGPGAHAPVVIGKSHFRNSRFRMHNVTDLTKPRSPIHVRVSSSTSPLLVELSDIARSRFLDASIFHSWKPRCLQTLTRQDLPPCVPADGQSRTPIGKLRIAISICECSMSSETPISRWKKLRWCLSP
jgi:hypothetical protein